MLNVYIAQWFTSGLLYLLHTRSFEVYNHWNDWRSRRVFLCFLSAIFKLMSAKFPTFAYNSRTVWSRYMKFWQQFKIIDLYVSINFFGNWSRDFGLRTQKPPQKFGVKSDLFQKRLKYVKQYFTRLYVLRYPFISTNPLLTTLKFFSCSLFFFFFSFFFFLNLVRSSPKPQNIEILFLCKVVELQT